MQGGDDKRKKEREKRKRSSILQMPRHIHEIFEKETPCSSMDGRYITVQFRGRAGRNVRGGHGMCATLDAHITERARKNDDDCPFFIIQKINKMEMEIKKDI
jgi:hypothetical protein